MPAPLPDQQTRINVRVNAADWEWLNANHPGQANKLMRALLAAWVQRERQRTTNKGG